MWQLPVGLLHADAQSDAGDVGLGARDLLGVFAEAVGAILERNAAVERMNAVRGTAQAHSREIRSLTVLFDDSWPGDATACHGERADPVPDPS